MASASFISLHRPQSSAGSAAATPSFARKVSPPASTWGAMEMFGRVKGSARLEGGSSRHGAAITTSGNRSAHTSISRA